MKNAAFRKLSGKRGASVLIALLIFFLAALSGTIVLTMATSNAGRYTHEKEDQQSYLSVISAANLILSKLEGVEVYFECDKSPQNEENVKNDEIRVTFRSSTNPNLTFTGDMFLGDKKFQNDLKTFSRLTTDEIKSVAFTLSPPKASVSPTAEGESSNNHAEIGEVYVELTIEGTDLFFVLYYKDGEHFDYLLTLKVETVFDNLGNYTQDSNTKKFYRTMTFDTANATYTVGEFIEKTEKGEEKTEGEGGAGA